MLTESIADVLKDYGVDHIIKFHDQDFFFVKKLRRGDVFDHFTIPSCNHKKGDVCALARMEKPGCFDGKKEVKPIIDFNKVIIAECAQFKKKRAYDELSGSDYKHSIGSIKSTIQLKKAIVRRYRKSLANLTDKEKLTLGVSTTRFKVLAPLSAPSKKRQICC